MNPGAETSQVLLSRADASHKWGLRLQGGNDFSVPLSVQSVRKSKFLFYFY